MLSGQFSGYNEGVARRILCVANTEAILETRKLLLQQHGFNVVPALNFRDVEQACKLQDFDLVLVGQTFEPRIKKAIALKIREHCRDVPIVEMCRYSPEIEGSIFTVSDSPEDLIQTIADTLGEDPMLSKASNPD